MSQAFHGGQVAAAAEQFGLAHDSILDFSSNMNVFAPSIPAAAWGQWTAEITRYPEPDAETVREKLAQVYQLESDYILPTAGAIEGLYLTARLFSGSSIGIVEPGFSDYSRSFESVDCRLQHIILPPELWYAPAHKWAYLLEPFDVVVLGNPNNPTGAMQPRSELRQIFEMEWRRPKHWIVDEAFMEFVAGHDEQTLLSVINRFPSLIVLRSLTKSWRIPGLRLGFLATAGPVERLRKMQAPWSINAISQAWANLFLVAQEYAHLRRTLEELSEVKHAFRAQLQSVPGIRVYPAAANFLLVELIDRSLDANELYQRLGCRGLLVRLCDSFRGLAKGRFIRLAVRTQPDNELLVAGLSAVCAELVRSVA